MRKENTRDDSALSEETVLSRKEELVTENDTILRHSSNKAVEPRPATETQETYKEGKLTVETGSPDEELVLNKLSQVAVSPKPGGAWAAGPPSSMIHETNYERDVIVSQNKNVTKDGKERAAEPSTDRKERCSSASRSKQENRYSKEQRQVNGSTKSSPVLPNLKETPARSFSTVERESISNGASVGTLNNSWPPPGMAPQPYSVMWPGAERYTTTVSDNHERERNDDSEKEKEDVNSRSEVGSESSKYSTYLTNGYQTFQYPFHSYPSPFVPMQNMMVPPWFLYPYAPPMAIPRPPNVMVNNTHKNSNPHHHNNNNNLAPPSGYSYDGEQVSSKKSGHSSFQNVHKGNVSNGNATLEQQCEQKQEETEQRNKLPLRDNLSGHGGNTKSPKRVSTTNGKVTSPSMPTSPAPFGSFHGSFEKSQSMAAFYSPWPMVAPPFFWFPDPRMIDPYQTVTETALYVHQRIRPTRDESIRKASLFRHLYKLCQNEWKHCDLWMFGSSINSFGLRSGDLDMCLTVPSEDAIHRVTGEHLDERHIVNRLGVILRQAKMENVECRFRARVPIVKFHDPLTELSVDVCINNKLARHNSALLRTYASLDPRVQILGLLIKYWAKCRGINQPFTGTLSSYAYILLLIQFLQTRNRPLLPSLQQSVGGKICTTNDSIPQVIVDNCNVYFDTCITGYTSLLSSSNSDSVGLLLTEFFGFYAYSFDYSKHVVSIRCGRLLTREDKNLFIPPVDARIEESDEEDEHVNLENQLPVTSPSNSHSDVFPHDMDAMVVGKRESNEKDSLKAVSSGEENKHSSSSVLSPKMPVMNVFRMPKKHKRFKELHVFCIEDPFDTSHDIGRVVDEDSLEVLHEEFVRAYEIIRSTGNFLEVCRPYEGEK